MQAVGKTCLEFREELWEASEATPRGQKSPHSRSMYSLSKRLPSIYTSVRPCAGPCGGVHCVDLDRHC